MRIVINTTIIYRLIVMKHIFTYTALALALNQMTHAQDEVLPTITLTKNTQKIEQSTLKTSQKNLDIPQTVNTVSSQYISNYQPQNLDEALTQVSGITQGNTLGGTQDTVMKRGFGDNRDGSIMVNGMPIVQGRTMNAAVDKVEVLKGPSSLLYGIMDPGGVINVVPKKPQKEQSTVVSVNGSTYAQGRNGIGATIDTTGQIADSNFSYRLIANQSTQDYWRNFGINKQQLIAPSLRWDDGQTQVDVSYQYHKFDVPFDRSTVFDKTTNRALPISRTTRLDEASNQMTGEDHLAQLSIDHKINDQWSAHAGYSYNQETYDANQLRVTALNTAKHTVSRRADATKGALSIDSFGNAYVEGNFKLANLKHVLQLGTESEYRKYYRKDMLRGTATTFDYLNPDYGNTYTSQVSNTDSDQTDKLHTYGIFLQDSIYLTDQWIAVLGTRYTHWQQLAGKGRPFVVNTDTNDGKWLPRAGLVYKWTDQLSVYASYTQSLKPSSTIASLSSGITLTSSLLPEQATSYELGLKYEASDLSANIALYDIKKKNILVDTDIDTVASGKARSKGIEFDITKKLTDRLDSTLTYAYTDAKSTESTDTTIVGKPLLNVAKNTASLAFNYDYGTFYNGQLRFGLSGNYVGTRSGDATNSFRLPDYTLVNGFVSYATKIAQKDVDFKLNLNNIFDTTYYTASVSNLAVSVGDSRQAVLSATMRF